MTKKIILASSIIAVFALVAGGLLIANPTSVKAATSCSHGDIAVKLVDENGNIVGWDHNPYVSCSDYFAFY